MKKYSSSRRSSQNLRHRSLRLEILEARRVLDGIVGNAIPDLTYDPLSGELTVDTDGFVMQTLQVSGPVATSIDRWIDGTFQDGGSWAQGYSGGREQWGATGGSAPPDDAYQIATYTPLLTSADFGQVIYASYDGQEFITDVQVLAMPGTTIDGRHVFYNNSSFDGNTLVATAADDDAVATDKQPLLPNETATFANYTSYSRGMNGIMVDVAGLLGRVPNAADFEFRVGNNDDPNTWDDAPAPLDVTVRPGEGTGGSDRVTVIWADNAIQKEWLQVKVLATDNTGLAQPDVFYFGNAIGEAGNKSTHTLVNAADQIFARNNQNNDVGVDNPYDFNRDGFVTFSDESTARLNQTDPFSALQLIQAPPGDGLGNPAPAPLLAADAILPPPIELSGEQKLLAELAWAQVFESADSASDPDDDTAATQAVDKLLDSYWA